jgi:hypothetical protein
MLSNIFHGLRHFSGLTRMPKRLSIFTLPCLRTRARLDVLRNIDDSRAPNGSILTIAFELDGQKFTALNGGPMFKFTEAISLVVRCDSQQEHSLAKSVFPFGRSRLESVFAR